MSTNMDYARAYAEMVYGQPTISAQDAQDLLSRADLASVAYALDSLDLVSTDGNKASMQFPGGGRSFEVERNPDRTLHTEWANNVELPDPSRRDDARPEYANLRIRSPLESAMQQTAAIDILAKSGIELNKSNVNMLLGAMRDTEWTKELPKPLSERMQGVRHIVEIENALRELIDPDAHGRSKNVRGKVPMDRYNRVAVGGGAIRDLQGSNPMAAAWVATRRDMPTATYEHPGEVISTVRSDLEESGLGKSSWKQASKINPEIFEHVVRGRISRPAVAMILNAMAKYQIKDPSMEQIRDARDIASQYASAGLLDHEGDERREQLERTLAFALRSDHERGNDEERRDSINEITDFVTSRLRNNQPVTATTWGGLVKASDQWHRDQVHVEMQRMIGQEAERNEGKIRAWSSVVGEMEMPGRESDHVFRATPLTDPLQLFREGREMQHCVGSYGDACHSGRSRIFAIRGSDGEKATVELTLHGDKWSSTQMRGPLNAKVSPGMMQAARQVTNDYQQGWDSAKDGEAHRQEWVAVEDFDQPVSALSMPNPRPPRLDLKGMPSATPPPEIQGEVERYRLAQELEREADRAERQRDRQAEYIGDVGAPAYVPRGGRGRIGY